MRVAIFVALFALVFSTEVWAFGTGEPSVPQDDREFFVDETLLPFDGIPGLSSTRLWGVDNGAGFRIEVPANWNGDLVMYTHGFRGSRLELTVDNPPQRAFLLANGFAWAASSYSANFYDVRAGVNSTNSLARYFKRNVAEPNRVFMTGFSMGGHVIGAAVEQYPNVLCAEGSAGRLCRRFRDILGRLSGGIEYSGAVPMCGVMGDEALFQYFGDFSYVAETLAGVPSIFPPPPNHSTTILPATLAQLYVNPEAFLTNPAAAIPNAQGLKLRQFTTQVTGGQRPLAEASFPFFQGLLFSFSGADGTLDGVLTGNIYDNTDRIFQLDQDPALNSDEQFINDAIIRIARDQFVNPESLTLRPSRLPRIKGRLAVPVVSVHTLGDLFVPFSMEQIYAQDVQDHGRSDFLVSRATRAVGHCEFSPEEVAESFTDMINWVNTGVKPAGDDILDPANVANPLFGCQFSRGTTPTRPFAPCP